MSTIAYPRLDELLTACRAAGIDRLALCWRREWGPPQVGTDPGDYARRDELRVLGYAHGTIHACEPVGHDRDELARQLEGAGFRVELRSRNLTHGM